MSGCRVVLLARPGTAREHAEAALRDAGADVAAVLDPLASTPVEVRGARPNALLVILDPQVEAVLEAFDPVLDDAAINVLYDEADVAAKRGGWEAARWARHLAAKLMGHADVLPPTPGSAQDFSREMQALSVKVAELPPPEPVIPVKTNRAAGAVVVVAGVGGPDAVRQLLTDLPQEFPQPVLVRQPVSGEQYDRLLRQMQRAAQMDVRMAEVGEMPQRSTVYIMPSGVDVVVEDEVLLFSACAGEPRFTALNAANSAMLLLSGAPVAMVDVALAMRWAGALVFGQATENCFDPAASQSLVARGGEARSLAIMAKQLRERWHD